MDISDKKECEMILLCGYLGSGKTTLIQNILKRQNKYKVAVIQNEFSDEMGIESPLMQDSAGLPFDKFYELPNGCLCCTAQSDLLRAVEYLITQEKYQLDYILIETNGLADPSNTIQEFWVDSDSKFPAKLKTVQTLVAIHSFDKMRQGEQKEIFERQLVYADNIFINHIDRENDSNRINAIQDQLIQMNPLANIHHTSFGNLDNLDKIFLQQGYNENKQFSIEKIHNLHTSEKIKHIYIESDNDYDEGKMNILIGTILWEEKDKVEVMRTKGLLRIKDNQNMFTLQGVSDTFELVDSSIPNDSKQSKILVIYQLTDEQYDFENDFKNRLEECSK